MAESEKVQGMVQRQAGQEHSHARGVSTSCGLLLLAVLDAHTGRMEIKCKTAGPAQGCEVGLGPLPRCHSLVGRLGEPATAHCFQSLL